MYFIFNCFLGGIVFYPFLVLSSISSSGLLFLSEREYLLLIFAVIYVGAVAVLFLFVVMTLDIKSSHLSKYSLKYFPFGSFIGFVFFIELLVLVPIIFDTQNSYTLNFLFNFYLNWFNKLDCFTEITSIGHILYTDYVVQFLLSGNLLLLATFGPVTLSFTRPKQYSKNQTIFKQLSRTYNSVVYII